jgi:hypothetical protein
MACAIVEGARSLQRPPRSGRLRKHSQRAGPALPSYLALHHAGFSVPPMLPPERWALTPPFHPCQTERAFRGRLAGFPARCHRASLSRRYILCGTFREQWHRLQPVDFSSLHLLTSLKRSRTDSSLRHRTPGVTRRVALFRHRLLPSLRRRCPDFPPAQPLLMTKPAITRLTRQVLLYVKAHRLSPHYESQKRKEFPVEQAGAQVVVDGLPATGSRKTDDVLHGRPRSCQRSLAAEHRV